MHAYELSVRVRVYYAIVPLSAAGGSKGKGELEIWRTGRPAARPRGKSRNSMRQVFEGRARNIIMRTRSKRVSSHLIQKRIACDR